MSQKLVKDFYYEYLVRVKDFKNELSTILGDSTDSVSPDPPTITLSPQDDIYLALAKVSIKLANSYDQVKRDLNDPNRISWAGTAHEIREIVTNLLRLLAPDNEIISQSWYKAEKDATGPTQKQRVKLILQKQSGGSKQKEVVELVTNMDNLIGDMVRATYSRASDAAHRSKGKTEAKRLLKYFEAFAQDLLNIE